MSGTHSLITEWFHPNSGIYGTQVGWNLLINKHRVNKNKNWEYGCEWHGGKICWIFFMQISEKTNFLCWCFYYWIFSTFTFKFNVGIFRIFLCHVLLVPLIWKCWWKLSKLLCSIWGGKFCWTKDSCDSTLRKFNQLKTKGKAGKWKNFSLILKTLIKGKFKLSLESSW